MPSTIVVAPPAGHPSDDERTHDDDNAQVPVISDLQSAVVATGIQLGGKTQMGNKGAVGIGFFCGEQSFLFLSCHFAAGQAR
jgi:hypothetical protein